MPYKIRTVSMEGIRGFNRSEEVTFDESITLIYGENGSGKSSLLQSIEWAMTGDIPYMKGGDFAREDAIVNLFNRNKKALVEISLRNQKSALILKRSRKMSSRTASGKQPLELDFANKTFKDQEAETELERVLNINLEGFSQSKYLHQETIREILQAKPEERSQAIDKLLGTYEVREFAKTIDIDKRTKASITALQDTMDALKRDKIQFHLNLKRSLDQTKASLLRKGYTEKELTLSTILKKIEQSKAGVESLKDRYGASLSGTLEVEADAESMIKAHRALLNQLNDLDRYRLESINRINNQKTNLSSKSLRYNEVYSQFQGMKKTDASTLMSRITEIDGELDDISSKVKDVRQKLVSLPHKRSIYEANKKKLESEMGKLKVIREEHGTAEEIQEKIKKGEEKAETIQSDLEKLSGQQTLITLAIEHLETTKTQECPVCFQSISNEELTKDLRTKVSDEITRSIKQLKESEKRIKTERHTLEGIIEENKELSQTVDECKKALATAGEDVRKLVPNYETQNLDEVMKKWEKNIEELSGKESEFREEQNKLKDTLTRLSTLLTELEKLKTWLQKETGSAVEGPKLLKKVEEITAALDEENGKYSDSSEVDTLRKTLAETADALNYLRDEERVLAAEKELPLVEKQITDLGARTSRLQALASSLESIRQLATAYQKEASLAQLKRLEETINGYYSKIQGHPHFTRLKIDVEKEDPLIFSVRAASTQEDTYIPTRFSTAQLNAVALSIFMSYSTQEAGDLPIMILDDPTQNMDTAHKEAFAKLIATLPPKHQVIIATEDDDTRRFLEKHCTSIKTYEMGNWTSSGTKLKVAGVG